MGQKHRGFRTECGESTVHGGPGSLNAGLSEGTPGKTRVRVVQTIRLVGKHIVVGNDRVRTRLLPVVAMQLAPAWRTVVRWIAAVGGDG